MSDVKLVISLDENKYRQITTMPNVYGSEICEAIRNATPYNPSGDLIDREALKEKLQARHDNGEEDFDKGYNIGIEAAIELLDNAPPVEITEEQAINKLHETGWLIGHDKEMTTRPQGVLTEAEKIICKAYLEDLDKTHTCNEYKLLMSLIDNAQAVDERPQNKWIKIFENPFVNGYKCPFCGHKIQVTEKFLPEVTECEACGADMRGGAE